MSTAARYPLRTWIIIVAVVALAGGAFVLGGRAADTDNSDSVSVSGSPGQAIGSDGVDAVVPGNGAQALSQQTFGIDLADGWAGELTLQPPDGGAIFIPPDQLERSALNELVFQPGPGKVITSLPTGNNCVRATIWSLVRGRDNSERVESWCFRVT